MSRSIETSEPGTFRRPNGSGAAAILAAGVGCFVLAILAVAGDQSSAVKAVMIFYKPTGPLSGVTTSAIVIWLATWAVLEWRWRKRTIHAERILAVSFVLLGLALLLTFPPVADLL